MNRFRHDHYDCSPGCPVEATLDLIGGKWKGVVLWRLLRGTLRFSEIRRRVPSVTPRMLTSQLRELESDGFITRTIHAEVPPKVEYRLTARGQSLEPIVLALKVWCESNLDLAFLKPAERPARREQEGRIPAARHFEPAWSLADAPAPRPRRAAAIASRNTRSLRGW